MFIIPNRESLSIEFKSDRKTISDETIIEGIVALANTDGGEMYIGVEDDGTPTGAQPSHRDATRMSSMIANNTVPHISVRVFLLTEFEHPILRIEVPRSGSIVATASGKMLRRRIKPNGEPESAPMYPYEISTRLSDLGKLDYSSQPLPDASRDDFDPVERERLRNIVRIYGKSDKSLLELSDEELEQSLGLITHVGDKYVPTLTGLLLIGRVEALRKYVPTSEAAFQVLEGTDIRVNEEYREPLLYTIDKIIDSIEPWNPVTEVQLGLFNNPIPAFDKRAIREAVVNAFAHRDYSMLGRVRVLIDDSGLTISNPGGFIDGITVDNLLTADPQGRNPALADALKRIGLAERTGRGIDRIFEGSLLYGRPLPDYSDTKKTSVNLYIARSAPDIDFVEMLAEEANKKGRQLSLQSLVVLDALKRFRRATLDEIKNEVDIRDAQLHQVVEQLVEAGLVEASGAGKKRSYILGMRVYRKSGKHAEYARQADFDRSQDKERILRLLASQGRITKADVAELLHLDLDEAYYEIQKLMKEKKLKLAKRGPDAYYVSW